MKKSVLVGIAVLTAGLMPYAASAQSDEMKDMNTFPRPIALADNVWIEELTMPEVRDLLADGWRDRADPDRWHRGERSLSDHGQAQPRAPCHGRIHRT